MTKNYIQREITNETLACAKEYPILTISGPRQSGKTTLAKHLFGELPYYNLESPDTLDLILNDPRAFLEQNQEGAIIDEIQRAPELISYLQVTVDENKRSRFIITGSNQFSLLEKVTQSLAGRTAILKLLPLSFDEISSLKPNLSADQLIFAGSLPSIYSEGREPTRSYRNYYETYVERDVRSLINIKDISLFRKFMKLCAGRTGQIFNASQLANETGVSVNTIKSWVSVLETSFIVYLLPPWYDNINKRLVKSPKLYFYEIGLVTYLLGITNPDQLQRDPLRGGLFENLVINELVKKHYNSGMDANVFFFRDKHGNEIDLLMPRGNKLIPVEIKSSQTYHKEFNKNINYIKKIYPDRIKKSYLVYGGVQEQITEGNNLINFLNISKQIELI
ncbi:MAG: ATP-binding protein [Bacteroidetes bacterium]|nr:ATP-binding protein [Bacteroidota bacterium]